MGQIPRYMKPIRRISPARVAAYSNHQAEQHTASDMVQHLIGLVLSLLESQSSGCTSLLVSARLW